MTTQDITLASLPPAFTVSANNQAITLKNTYLPPATASALGGIKVGANLSITADGTLSTPGAIPAIWSETGYVTTSATPPANTIQVTYTGVKTLAQVNADFPAGSVITTTVGSLPAYSQFTVAATGASSPSAGVYNIPLTTAIPAYTSSALVLRYASNVSSLLLGDGLIQDSNSRYSVAVDGTTVGFNANKELQAFATGVSLWLTGANPPANSLGQVSEYYQDTSLTSPGNRIWLKTQASPAPWDRQEDFETSIISNLGQTLRFSFARVAALTNIALSGLVTIDGVALSAGDIVLAIGQTVNTQDGLYVAASGAWARENDNPIVKNLVVRIDEGTISADDSYIQTNDIVNIATDAQNWSFFSDNNEQTLNSVCAVGSSTTGNITTGNSITVGPSTENYLSLARSNAGSPVSLTAQGPDANIDFTILTKFNARLQLGGQRAFVAQLVIDTRDPANLKLTGSVSDQNLRVAANGGGSSVLLGNASAGYLNIVGATSFGILQITPAGPPDQSIALYGNGAGSVFIGGGVSATFAGLRLSTTSTAVTISSTGPSANVNVVIEPKNVGGTFLFGYPPALPPPASQARMYLPQGIGSNTLAYGSAGDVVTSNGTAGAPYWGRDGGLPSTVFLLYSFVTNRGRTLTWYVTQYNNDLNLSTTYDSSSNRYILSGFGNGVRYFVEVSAFADFYDQPAAAYGVFNINFVIASWEGGGYILPSITGLGVVASMRWPITNLPFSSSTTGYSCGFITGRTNPNWIMTMTPSSYDNGKIPQISALVSITRHINP